MGCHILLVPVLQTGSQILRKEVGVVGTVDADLDEFTTGRLNKEAKWEMESSFDIGNGSRLRKLSICNRSMGSSFKASKS
jgi:hypothetical protein